MESAIRAQDIPRTASPEAAAPRLAPIRSWNPLVWLTTLIYRFSIGSTAPVGVIFARAPRTLLAHILLMATSEYGLSLDARLRSLARVYGSRVNGCLYCDDLETRLALQHKSVERADVDALPSFRTSDRFSAREKAALQYIEEVNTTRRASDETFENLRRHFAEREIVELTWLNAVGNYLNLQAKPLGLLPDGACEIPARASDAKPVR
ncbi:MAG TPA: carboxymuconolactone decarboxylase family protein [Candidatus Binatia bacterium]|jgi:AhpD family alkylhydroperoxidase